MSKLEQLVWKEIQKTAEQSEDPKQFWEYFYRFRYAIRSKVERYWEDKL